MFTCYCGSQGVGRSDLREANEDCSTDIELGCLTFECARDDTLADQLEAVHFGPDQVAANWDGRIGAAFTDGRVANNCTVVTVADGIAGDGECPDTQV